MKKDRKGKRLKHKDREKYLEYKLTQLWKVEDKPFNGSRTRQLKKVKRSAPIEKKTEKKPEKKPEKVSRKKDRKNIRKDRKKHRNDRTGLKNLDYDKTFVLPKGMYFQIGYRDLTCEIPLETILLAYSKKSNKWLYERIIFLLKMEQTYDRETYRKSKGHYGGSSGRAGKCEFTMGSIIEVQADLNHWNNRNNRTRKISQDRKREGKPPLWYHHGQFDYWQHLSQDGKQYLSRFTPRQLMIIAVGIMSNVVEYERNWFYYNLYSDLCLLIPELKIYLPDPNLK